MGEGDQRYPFRRVFRLQGFGVVIGVRVLELWLGVRVLELGG